MKHLIVLLLFSHTLAAQTLPVALKKSLWADARGELTVSQEGITFQASDQEEAHTWAYRDIQGFDRISKTEFVILSYEDQRWKLGRDRRYHFTATSGELSDELFERIRERMAKPVTNRVVGEVSGAEYQLPVKHLHSFGGCEGQLIFTPEAIYYETKHAEDRRAWRLTTEVESVWSAQPHELELHVYENNPREFSRTRIYKFSLKEPLDSEFYRRLKLKLYNLDASRASNR